MDLLFLKSEGDTDYTDSTDHTDRSSGTERSIRNAPG